MAGERILTVGDGLRRPLRDELAAKPTGAGAKVDDVISPLDCLLVVLDNDDRVPQVAQSRQAIEELRVVPSVKPDRRFVEDVKNSAELRSNLRR